MPNKIIVYTHLSIGCASHIDAFEVLPLSFPLQKRQQDRFTTLTFIINFRI
jgi:hypothetical protein